MRMRRGDSQIQENSEPPPGEWGGLKPSQGRLVGIPALWNSLADPVQSRLNSAEVPVAEVPVLAEVP
eukprot:22520-Rhodomonas_salina.1